ncbi:MAG: hypothetical protein K6C94_02570 [Candidatus Gastranaerophilales bacterium]|nr:hypothetical protein [Candidatus Gastranaerophilales bacterium]
MGKCKKRTLNKPVLEKKLSRESAIEYIVEKVRGNCIDNVSKQYLSLFCITPEELTEAGAAYEEVLVLSRFM